MGKAEAKLEIDVARGYSLDKIKKALGENNACYVLITCGSPSKDGKMDVEMFYEGDEVLAAYLIDNAQQVFENNRGPKTIKPK